MKTFLFSALLVLGVLSIQGQADRTALLTEPETSQSVSQDKTATATIKSSTRLFRIKEDLTSVIMIIPSGSVVSIIGSDSTYDHITYDENEGYIFRKHAVPDKPAANTFKEVQSGQSVKEKQPAREETDSRYNALESKYGAAMASRIYSGKIWKGMNAEMVKDSWGRAEKINRVINGNVIREEWIYNTTWLYFENNTLLDWGPAKK